MSTRLVESAAFNAHVQPWSMGKMPTHQCSEGYLNARARIRDATWEQFALHGVLPVALRPAECQCLGIASAA